MVEILLLVIGFGFLGMAKTEGPLFSLEARGKIGDAVVYFPWKGRHVVRQWLKPTNPQSTLQGYVRSVLKAVSKWVAKIVSVSNGGALDSDLYQAFTASADAGLNWNAWICAGLLDAMQSGGTFQTGSFTDLVAEYSSLGTDELASFAAEATSIGIVDFAFNYGYTTNIPAGLQLFLGAKACYNKSVVGAAPYDTDPASWATDDIGSFVDGMTTNT